MKRLSKILSERGICSRREADRFIEEGQVLVDGKVISELGTRVPDDAQITLLSKAKKTQGQKVTILLNKPIGYVSTQPEKGYLPAIDLITEENHIKQRDEQQFHPAHLKKLAVAGRLDIDSKGLLILTQDGVIAKRIIGENSSVEKEYLVRFEGTITEEILKHLRYGLAIDGKALRRAQIDVLQPNVLRFILREGKKRQIRRMCELVGLKVIGLKRVRVGHVRLGKLPEGKWRFLRPDERF